MFCSCRLEREAISKTYVIYDFISVAPHMHLRRKEFHLDADALPFIPTTTLQRQLLPFVLTWHEQTEHLSFSSTQI